MQAQKKPRLEPEQAKGIMRPKNNTDGGACQVAEEIRRAEYDRDEAEFELRRWRPEARAACEKYHEANSKLELFCFREERKIAWIQARDMAAKFEKQLADANARLADIERQQAEAERQQRIATATAADVPDLAPVDLFDLAPELLQHATLDQAKKLSRADRDRFTPDQAQALASVFAQVDAMRREAERARFEASRERRRAEAEAERQSLLDELGIVPISLDFAGHPAGDVATPMLIDGWIPAGRLTLLHGAKEDGKTTVAAGIVLSLSTGVAVFPSLVPSDGPKNGIVVMAEDTPAQFDEILCAYNALDPVQGTGRIIPWRTREPLMVDHGGGWEPGDTINHLVKLIEPFDIDYIILDHLGTLADNMDILADRHMRRLLNCLSQIAEEHDVTIILLHHTKDGGTAPYGSVYLRNLPRCILRINATADGAKLTQTNYNHDMKQAPVRLERVGRAFREVVPHDDTADAPGADTVDDDATPVDIGALIVDWLRDHPEAVVPVNSIRLGKGDAVDLLAWLREQVPGLRPGKAAEAAAEAVESGQLIAVETTINRKPRTVLAVP